MSTDATQEVSEQGNHTTEKKDHQTYNEIAAEHIDRLNEVNRQLPKVLTYFATAITQLTNNPIKSNDENEEDSKATRLAAFRKYTLFVGLAIAQIREELKEQINDLERQKVIPRSQPKFTTEAPKGDDFEAQKQGIVTHDLASHVTNGGYGNFDIGVLNARASKGQVEGEDVLDRVKGILEELQKRASEAAADGGMVVDG